MKVKEIRSVKGMASLVSNIGAIIFGALGFVLGACATWGVPSARLAGGISTGLSVFALFFSLLALFN